MSPRKSAVQVALYCVFLVTCLSATTLGLLMIWGVEVLTRESETLWRIFASCIVLMVASAFTMSATRLVAGRAPEDDRS